MNYLHIILLALGLLAAGLVLILIRFSSTISQAEEECCKPFIGSCPHCGGRAEFRTFTKYDGQISYETGAVVCSQCGAQTKEEIASGYYGISVSPEAIIQKWNRRCER